MYIAALEEVKTEALLELSHREQLVRVIVTAKELTDKAVFDFKEEGEFVYRGKMYDYKKVEKNSDNTIFYAFEDNREERLLDLLTSSFEEGSSSKGNSSSVKLLKSFSKDYMPNSIFLQNELEAINSFLAVRFKSYLSKGYPCLVSSPPDKLTT